MARPQDDDASDAKGLLKARAGATDGVTYLDMLEDALAILGTFDNHIDAKIKIGKLIDPEATAVLAASAETRALIQQLVEAAF